MEKKTTWPREYLLQVYNHALEHGSVRLQPISALDAKSFTATFYRLRRRSDSSNVTFITPEMHLVTVGKWVDEAGGTLPIYYNQLPAGEEALPNILPGLDDEPVAYDPTPPMPLSTKTGSVLDTEDETLDTDAFVNSLAAKAHARDS